MGVIKKSLTILAVVYVFIVFVLILIWMFDPLASLRINKIVINGEGDLYVNGVFVQERPYAYSIHEDQMYVIGDYHPYRLIIDIPDNKIIYPGTTLTEEQKEYFNKKYLFSYRSVLEIAYY